MWCRCSPQLGRSSGALSMTLATNPTSQPIIDSYEMKFTAYTESDKQEIQHLFTETFSDSENRAEGELIGQLCSI